MEPVADGIYKLGSRSHNFYLLIEDDQATIVDAGCVREWDELSGALTSADLNFADVHAVIITHAHSDHLGLGPRMQQEDMTVVVHEDEETRAVGTYTGRFAASATDLPLWSPRAWMNMWPMMRAGVTRFEHLEMVGTFRDGDTIDTPGHPKAIHTPGHTEGHTMFYCEAQGVLFTGDGLVTMDLLGSRRGPQMMPPVFDLDSETAVRSLNRIVDLDAGLILPGHGEPWRGTPAAAVDLITT